MSSELSTQSLTRPAEFYQLTEWLALLPYDIGHFLLLYIFRIWRERWIELVLKLNLHKSKNKILYRNLNWLHILLGFVYSNLPLVRGLTEAGMYQYLKHLFKEKF